MEFINIKSSSMCIKFSIKTYFSINIANILCLQANCAGRWRRMWSIKALVSCSWNSGSCTSCPSSIITFLKMNSEHAAVLYSRSRRRRTGMPILYDSLDLILKWIFWKEKKFMTWHFLQLLYHCVTIIIRLLLEIIFSVNNSCYVLSSFPNITSFIF